MQGGSKQAHMHTIMHTHTSLHQQEKNLATLMHFALPCLVAVYAAIILQGYSVKEFNGLVTNRYFLLGALRLSTGSRWGRT